MTTLFIGLGAMGAPMATNLAKGNEPLFVFDVNPAAAHKLAETVEAQVTETLHPLPNGIDTVVLMVPNSRIVEDILTGDTGLFAQLQPDSLVIDMSSSEPGSARTLAATAAGHHLEFVDAPVSGGVAKATTGELAIMAGGSNAAFDRAKPFLSRMGTSIHHVGAAGAGDAAKALNNLLSATNIAAAAEVLSAASRFGIEPAAMLDVINASTSRSQASEVKYTKHILPGTFNSGFAMDLMLKDLKIARTLTSEAGLATPITDAGFDVAHASREYAGTPPDHTEIARFYEARNNVELRG